jgi:hypothetical protein
MPRTVTIPDPGPDSHLTFTVHRNATGVGITILYEGHVVTVRGADIPDALRLALRNRIADALALPAVREQLAAQGFAP